MANSGPSSLFCFRRNDHLGSVLDSFSKLLADDELTDCSLVCEGKVLRAHKVLLSASSQYFRVAFKSLSSFHSPCHSTAVIIKDMPFDDLKTIVDFIYRGEILVEQSQVPSLIRSAEALEVAGLYTKQVNDAKSSHGQVQTNSSALNLQKMLPATGGNPRRSSEPDTYVAPSHHQSMRAAQPAFPGDVEAPPAHGHSQAQQPGKCQESSAPSEHHSSPLEVQLRELSPNLDCHSDDYSSGEEIEFPKSDSGAMDVTQRSDNGESRVVIEESDELEPETDKVIDLSSSNGSSDTYEHKKLKGALKLSENGIGGHLAAHLAHGDSPNLARQLHSPPHSRAHNMMCASGLGHDATARAIAASTTLAVVSNFFSEQAAANLSKEDAYAQLLLADNMYKRGRGRPPRYMDDDVPSLQSYNATTPALPPNHSFSIPRLAIGAPESVVHSTPAKRARVGDGLTPRGRRPKSTTTPTRDVSGKNQCPHCPQVYYSTQAMNDHINNVHSMNAQKYVCRLCAKEFSWKISLNKHLRKLHNEDPTNTLSIGKPIENGVENPFQ